jgi:two-component system sensor histidine kinase AtoS
VRTVLELVRREGLPGDLILRAELPEDLPEILVDRDKIKQVLFNLVQNAVQAVGPRAGEVVVSAGLQRVRGQEGRVEEALTLSVTDTGRGIADEDMEAISQRLVQAHGGDIAVRTRPGGPTTFTLRLPRYPEVSLPLLAPVSDEPRSPSMPR